MVKPNHGVEKLRKAFVCGWPIKHSRSPLIHNHWLKAHGIDGSYERIAVEPDALHELMDAVRAGEYIGGNITVPHKEAAMALVDAVDETANLLGAINTIYMRDGRLIGTNTDWLGFANALGEGAPGWSQNAAKKTALVIGAGGAARAILFALGKAGFGQIIVTNRTLARAKHLCDQFACVGHFTACGFDEAIERIGETLSIAVNTTSMGMAGGPQMDQRVEAMVRALPADAIANDIVYVPLITPFLSLAQSRNLKTVDGLGMLMHQAVPGFEAWFGVRPQVTDTLRNILLRDLGEG